MTSNKKLNRLLEYIEKYITSSRKAQLIALYTTYEDRLSTMPASSKLAYHSAFEGGYIHHVCNVVDNALLIAEVWKQQGANINFTTEELIFSALNHDLGKLGTLTEPYYIKNTSEWHVKNQGAVYTKNPKCSFMDVPDRSLFILQQYGIPVSENEYLAIKLHDGLYGDAAKNYLMNYSADNKPKSALVYILHQADLMAARIEFEQQYLYPKEPQTVIVNEPVKRPNKNSLKAQAIAQLDTDKGLLNTLKNL